MALMALILAASLALALVGWHLCGFIEATGLRAGLRAAVIALCCSPGVLVGHGIAVVPSLYALAVFPSLFSIGPVLVVFAIVLVAILAKPGWREATTSSPVSAIALLQAAPTTQLVVLGAIAAALVWGFQRAGLPRFSWLFGLQWGLVFAGAGANLFLCRWLAREGTVVPALVALPFAVPAAALTTPFLGGIWYAGGLVGALFGVGRQRQAWLVLMAGLAVLLLLTLHRVYLAANAGAHVTIVGGVVGNGVLAALLGAALIWTWLSSRGVRDQARDQACDQARDQACDQARDQACDQARDQACDQVRETGRD